MSENADLNKVQVLSVLTMNFLPILTLSSTETALQAFWAATALAMNLSSSSSEGYVRVTNGV